jgi:hypothetical protein
MQNAKHRAAIACWFFLGIATLLTGDALAADPQLGNIAPQGGQRGTAVVVHFHGARIGQDPLEIVRYEIDSLAPGIEFAELKSIDVNHAQAKLTIGPDCRIGIHPLRVRTATGLTRVRTFHVGALPEIEEKEPNSDFSSPQPIPLDVTVQGVIKSEDVDYFVIEAKKGQRITAQLEGLRLGRTFFDPYLAILNPQRFELATSDDTALLAQDPVVSILAPEDGKYMVSVRESAFGGSDACTYRLHVGRFPRPLALLPAGGRPGETMEVSWLGGVAGPVREQITVPTDPRQTFGLCRQDPQGIAPSPNMFRIGNLENVLESEPNNATGEATPVDLQAALTQGGASGVAMNGVIEHPGDTDHFRLNAKKGQVLDIQVYARRLRSPLDPVLHIRQAKDNKYLAGNDDTGGKPDSYLRFTAPEEGEYVLQIHDHLHAGGPYYTYRIEAVPPASRVELQIAERQRWVATKLELPRGNRTAFMVNAARRDFGGPLDVRLENLQTGATFETVTMQANRGTVPVVLAAAVDAPLAVSLPQVVASPAEEGKSATSSFSQRTWLVKGRNNVEVWSHYADRAAVAVTSEVPYQISFVQPKVPLVRGGSMQLKVIAQRAEGFDAPIAVRMLYNPPGISSSRSISIAKGKTEATIPLTASGNAPIQPWDICIEGQANINGRVLVSTPLGKLDIRPPYVALTYPKGTVELGQAVNYPVGLTVNTPFEGSTTVTLQGLPAGVTAEPLEMTATTKELKFHIQTTEKAPPGMHKTLLCQFTILQDGEPIAHTLGTGQLRIDKPLPPKEEGGRGKAKG